MQQPDAPLAQRGDGRDDVVGAQREVLHAGAAVVVEVLGDLALAQAVGRLVDRLHDLAAVPHHGRTQRGELGRDRFLAEVLQLAETPHPVVPRDPFGEPAVLDVGDDVVEAGEPDRRAEREAGSAAGSKPGRNAPS